ncbi:hypothetical protein AKJ16_DCAP17495 [Drosera capensis]
MRVLKTAVISAYRDYKVSRNCKWIPKTVEEEYLQCVKMVEKGIQRTHLLSNCTGYWLSLKSLETEGSSSRAAAESCDKVLQAVSSNLEASNYS